MRSTFKPRIHYGPDHKPSPFVVVFASGGQIPAPTMKAAKRIIEERTRTHAKVHGGIYDGEGKLIETFRNEGTP